ncbi:MAG: ABC transporter ATP-binding protein [Clostridia bacterium]|nr:ABC transporter ATP-binding protein [Clostridia bacterium]
MGKPPKTKKEKIPVIPNLKYILGMVWKREPAYLICSILAMGINAFFWAFFAVVFMRYLFGETGIDRTFAEAATFVWVVVIAECILVAFQNYVWEVIAPRARVRLRYDVHRMLFKKAANADVECYETPEFYGTYTMAANEATDRIQQMVRQVSVTLSYSLSAAFTVGTMLSMAWWSIFFLLLPLVGNWLFGPRVNRLFYERDQKRIPFQRRFDYVNRTAFLQKYAGEMRMTPLFSLLEDTYTEAYDGACDNINQTAKGIARWARIRNMILYPLAFEGMLLVVSYVTIVHHLVPLGDFVVLSSAIMSAGTMIRFVTNTATDLNKNCMFVQNLRKFMAYEPKIPEDQDGRAVTLPVQTIELRDVSFRYEGQTRDALSHVSLTLRSGETVAVVGFNGSGKSTLIKLIMRLYDPTEGVILLNGVDIREYNVKEYRRLIGAAFQDFAMFSATVLENVMLSRVPEEKRETAVEALRESGVLQKAESLEHGVDTRLTREFDEQGAVLSGGENQKIAVARAFAKESPVVVLDEPSSALDPIAEYQMYETILRLCRECDPAKGKIAILISHRLSSAALSDRVYMLKDGELIESGTHKELMALDGEYADMFKKQAKAYLVSDSGEEVSADASLPTVPTE